MPGSKVEGILFNPIKLIYSVLTEKKQEIFEKLRDCEKSKHECSCVSVVQF